MVDNTASLRIESIVPSVHWLQSATEVETWRSRHKQLAHECRARAKAALGDGNCGLRRSGHSVAVFNGTYEESTSATGGPCCATSTAYGYIALHTEARPPATRGHCRKSTLQTQQHAKFISTRQTVRFLSASRRGRCGILDRGCGKVAYCACGLWYVSGWSLLPC